jgi:DNA-directed RNA polymerase II subunit RPB1
MAIVNDSKIVGIQFSIMSPTDIRKGSVAEITNRDTYVNNKAVVGGLFDIRMGGIEPGILCPTDGLDHIQTPGYFGHIELAKPVFYIQYLDTVIGILSCICIKCSKLLIDKHKHHHLLSLSSERRWKQVHSLCHKVECCGESSETGCGCKQQPLAAGKNHQAPRIPQAGGSPFGRRQDQFAQKNAEAASGIRDKNGADCRGLKR